MSVGALLDQRQARRLQRDLDRVTHSPGSERGVRVHRVAGTFARETLKPREHRTRMLPARKPSNVPHATCVYPLQ
jgi:hypothetical protein